MAKSWCPRALRSRLLIASFLLLPVVLAVAGFVLQDVFCQIIRSSFEKRMRFQVMSMIVDSRLVDGRWQVPDYQRHLHIGADETNMIYTAHGDLEWSSRPIEQLPEPVQKALRAPPPEGDQTRFIYFPEQDAYLYQYPVIRNLPGQELLFVYSAYKSGAEVSAYVFSFQSQLWGWLFTVVVLALLLQTLITGWGLRPLNALVRDLRQIEKGEASRLGGRYPQEVQGVTDSLNHLLYNERNQRERYRNTLGDLAHSLKTPLAVIRGAGNERLTYDGYRNIVDEQVRRMDQIVQYQLARAVRSQKNVTVHATPLAQMIRRIAFALEKVYREKGVKAQLMLDETALYGADDRDMMELLGNVLENAFKYSRSQVAVSLSKDKDWVRLSIEDDGPGVSPDMRQTILERGARIDTSSAPGQGIGLTVAVDIISSYDGQLDVGESSALGGAIFNITLPLG